MNSNIISLANRLAAYKIQKRLKPETAMTHRAKIFLILSVLTAIAFLLSAKPAFEYLNAERAYLKEKSQRVELSYYFPDFAALARYISTQKDLDVASGDYLAYYLKTGEMYPNLKEIYPFVGFFYAKGEQYTSAIEAYETAIQHNPQYFWSYYNLAVLYRRNGELRKSNALIQRALELKPQVTLYVINQSTLYRQIWRHMPDAEGVITKNLKHGFEDCVGVLILNLYELKEYQALLQVAAQAVKGDYSRKEFVTTYAQLAIEELKGRTTSKANPPEDPFDFRLF